MHIIIDGMLSRERERDLLREAAQRRLAHAALKRRRAERGALHTRIGDFFAGFGQRLRVLMSAR
jgi:hypothetical protein